MSSRPDKVVRMQTKEWQMLDNRTCKATRNKNKRASSKVARKAAKKEAEAEECENCASVGGDPIMCDACSAVLCSKCDVHSGCPSCGAELP